MRSTCTDVVVALAPDRKQLMVSPARLRLTRRPKNVRFTDREFETRFNTATKILTEERKASQGTTSNWARACFESKLSKPAIQKAQKRLEKHLSLRASHTGGRPKGISNWVVLQLESTQRQRTLGDGYTLDSFLTDVQKFSAEEQATNYPGSRTFPVELSPITAKRYFRRLFPESAMTESTQNAARVSSALNGTMYFIVYYAHQFFLRMYFHCTCNPRVHSYGCFATRTRFDFQYGQNDCLFERSTGSSTSIFVRSKS